MVDASLIQNLIRQEFKSDPPVDRSAKASGLFNPFGSVVQGQFGDRPVQMGPAPGPRTQASASVPLKNLYNRFMTYIHSTPKQRTEQGITRGVQNFDKALGKLLDAMVSLDGGNTDLAKVRRFLENLSDSAKPATSRGIEFDVLLKIRLDMHIAKWNDKEIKVVYKAVQSGYAKLTQELNQLKGSGREHKSISGHREFTGKLVGSFFREMVARGNTAERAKCGIELKDANGAKPDRLGIANDRISTTIQNSVAAAEQNVEIHPGGDPENASKSFAYRMALGRLLDAMMPDDRHPINHDAFDLPLKDLRAITETSTKTDLEAFKKNFVNHVAVYSSAQLIKLEANTKAAIDRLNVQYNIKKDETLLSDLDTLILVKDDLSNELESRAASIPQVLKDLFKTVLSSNEDKASNKELSKLCHDYHQALHALKQVRQEQSDQASEIDDMDPLKESIKKYSPGMLSEISDQMEAIGLEWPQSRRYQFDRESEPMTLLNMATTIKHFLSSQNFDLLEISNRSKRPAPATTHNAV